MYCNPSMRKILFFFLFFWSASLYAQDFSNKGKDFWLAYPAHIDGNTSRMALYISSDVNTSGSVNFLGNSIPFTVTANQASVVQIFPSTYNIINAQNEGINPGKGINIVANDPVVVYAHVLNQARSGSTLVLPTNTLGREYIAASFRSSTNSNGSAAANSSPAGSQFTIVAVEDNTTVEIIPTAPDVGNTRAVNTAFNVTLNKGDVYQYRTTFSNDVTGTKIRSLATSAGSCKPIAVFSGSAWTTLDCTNASGGDNLFLQLFPKGAWGKEYITAPFADRQYDIFRIIVEDPTTVVTLNGNVLPSNSLINNSYYQFSSSAANIIRADKRIMVVQYMISQNCDTRNAGGGNNVPYPGDPEMVILNPIEQTINDVTVVSARNNLTPPNTNISKHFFTIIMKTNAISSLKIDGNAPTGTFTAIGTSGYSYLHENVTNSTLLNPSHRIQADSGFICLAYGMGSFESYGYNAGTNVRDLYQFVSVQNELAKVDFPATCVNAPFNFAITLPYQATSIKWDFSNLSSLIPNAMVDIPNPTPDSSFIRDGKTLYVFKLPGTYRFAAKGSFPIKVIANNPTPDGCSGLQEISYNVEVFEPPSAQFSVTSSGCANAPVLLVDSSTSGIRSISQWIWTYGDNTSNTYNSKTNPSKTYTAPGNYNINLKVVTDIGCVADKTIPVSLTSVPEVVFSGPSNKCLNDSVLFNIVSSNVQNGNIVEWRWDLDDGNGVTSYANGNPVGTKYTTVGLKTVRLELISNTGCSSGQILAANSLQIRPIPKANFGLPEVCLADASANFTDSSTIADNSNLNYLWNFGDQNASPSNPNTSTLKNPSHKYSAVGIYPLFLKVTSAYGCADSLTKSFTVNGSIPKADFIIDQANPLCSNLPVTITNTSTVDFGNITKLEVYWDYQNNPTQFTVDDNPTLGKKYTFKYPDFQNPLSKTIAIRLRAFSGASCVDDEIKTFSLNASPKVQFLTMPGICLDAAARQITHASELGNVPGTFSFFGTGVSSTGLITPSQIGVATVPIQYMFTSNQGCKDSASQNLTVWPSPTAVWKINLPSCEKNDIQFVDSSYPNYSKIVQWNWSFGDNTSIQRNSSNTFTKVYNNAGNYTASLVVITDSGCVSAPTIQTIRVNDLPKVNFSLPEICLPDGRGTFYDSSSIKDGSQALFSYRWDFGDPNDPSISLLKNPTHRYTSLGPKNVKLIVTTKDGCIDSTTKVLNTIYPQPKLNVNISPQQVCIGESIQFSDNTNGITSSVNQWKWSFGDGRTASTKQVTHTYLTPGKYQASVHVFNQQGCVSDTLNVNIEINDYPKADAGEDLFILEGGNKPLKTLVTGDSLSYKWVPAMYLSSDTAYRPICTPLDDIQYYLYATGKGGCTSKDSVMVTVLRSPVVPNAFSPNKDGVNDVWIIKYLDSYPDCVVEVFDRYGRQVYRSVGYSTPWDGTINGKELPIGTYYYIINPKNGRKQVQGSVTIIR